MNEIAVEVEMINLMHRPEGWGRSHGRDVYQKLIGFIEGHAGVMVYKIKMGYIKRVDISFASETVIEVARRFRGLKGFCFINLLDEDMIENWAAAAERKQQPLMVWNNDRCRIIGVLPSPGNQQAFEFALYRSRTTAADFALVNPGMSIANASNKYKQLWMQGFLLRRKEISDSGGLEFAYYRIG